MKISPLMRPAILGVLLPLTMLSLLSGYANQTTAQTLAEPDTQTPEKTAPKMPDKIITDAGNGATATLKVGQRLLVKLASNPTTGYEWGLGVTDDKRLPSDGETEFDAPTTEVLGAPTVQTLFFKAQAKGKVALELHYARPWEKDKAPAKVYKVTINVVE